MKQDLRHDGVKLQPAPQETRRKHDDTFIIRLSHIVLPSNDKELFSFLDCNFAFKKKKKMDYTTLCAKIFLHCMTVGLENDSNRDTKGVFSCRIAAKCIDYWKLSDQHEHLRNLWEMSHLSWVSCCFMWDNRKGRGCCRRCCCYNHGQRDGRNGWRTNSLCVVCLTMYWFVFTVKC